MDWRPRFLLANFEKDEDGLSMVEKACLGFCCLLYKGIKEKPVLKTMDDPLTDGHCRQSLEEYD